MTPRSKDGAQTAAPQAALDHGEFRYGDHQANNLYVTHEGVEYYVGALFRASYGPCLVDRLNRGRA